MVKDLASLGLEGKIPERPRSERKRARAPDKSWGASESPWTQLSVAPLVVFPLGSYESQVVPEEPQAAVGGSHLC